MSEFNVEKIRNKKAEKRRQSTMWKMTHETTFIKLVFKVDAIAIGRKVAPKCTTRKKFIIYNIRCFIY